MKEMAGKGSYRHSLHGQKAYKAPIGQTRSRLSLTGLDLECTTSLKLQQPRYNWPKPNSNKLSTIAQCTLLTTLVQALIACIQLQVEWTQNEITRHKMKDSLPYPSLAMQGLGA